MINMDIKRAIEILDKHNKWRRDNEGVYKMPDVKDVGIAIDTVVSEFRGSVDSGVVIATCEHEWREIQCGSNGIMHECKKCGKKI